MTKTGPQAIVTIIEGNALQKFKDDLAVELHGMTPKQAMDQNICIRCKKPPTFYSEAGRKEYGISQLCEPCWDNIMGPED